MIRMARQTDAEALADIYRPIVASTPISFELDPPDAAEMERRRKAVVAFAPWLVFEEERVLGYAYASKHRERAAYQWCVDVSVYVAEDQRRRGVGRALYTSLLELLRLQGFYAAHAGVTLPNGASVALHESFGFRRVATYPAVGFKMGVWYDVGWWQLELRPRVGTPPAPRTMAALQDDPAWAATLLAGEPRSR
ncbi:MAG TPA: arsinothricin resistance N-acetyltransferase ArsN1 family B [Myxococcales bacterium]|nr:arsinothricin resistance N-acetyltransferase ArsN1 family B [Myxococcales bacterium]